MRENDPERARAMAEFSDQSHTQAAEMREGGNKAEASQLDRVAYRDEMQAGALYDAKQEIQGLNLEGLRALYTEAQKAENDYAKSNLDAGNKEYIKDVVYIQLAQRRAVIEKALHEKEREQV